MPSRHLPEGRTVCTRSSSQFSIAVILIALVFSAAPATARGADAAKPAAADVVLEGAAVYTVDAARTWAEAVAIRGEEIVYVGTNAGAARYVGPQTRVVKLAGKMLLPGFQDAHLHPLWAGIEQLHCMLYGLESEEAYVREVAKYAASHPEESWIRGAGWDMAVFPGGIPNRHALATAARHLAGRRPDRSTACRASGTGARRGGTYQCRRCRDPGPERAGAGRGDTRAAHRSSENGACLKLLKPG